MDLTIRPGWPVDCGASEAAALEGKNCVVDKRTFLLWTLDRPAAEIQIIPVSSKNKLAYLESLVVSPVSDCDWQIGLQS